MIVTTQKELDAAIAAKQIIEIGDTKGEWLKLANAGSRVYANAGSRVYAYAGLRVDAYAGSRVYANAGSRVDANAGSRVYANAGSLVYANAGSRVYANAGSRVDAYAGSRVDAYVGSLVYAYAGSRVDAYAGSRVYANAGSLVYANAGSLVYAYAGSRVDAYAGSRVDAKSLSTLWAYDNPEIRAASKTMVVITAGSKPHIIGGCIKVEPPTIETVKQWATENCVEVKGVGKSAYAILGKAVDAEFRSPKGGNYTPDGKERVAADWDGGQAECGGGFHVCGTAGESRARFNSEAVKGVACKVYLRDCRNPQPNDQYPEKIKARACTPLYECDWDNEKTETKERKA